MKATTSPSLTSTSETCLREIPWSRSPPSTARRASSRSWPSSTWPGSSPSWSMSEWCQSGAGLAGPGCWPSSHSSSATISTLMWTLCKISTTYELSNINQLEDDESLYKFTIIIISLPFSMSSYNIIAFNVKFNCFILLVFVTFPET